jgi:hypothetical protein
MCGRPATWRTVLNQPGSAGQRCGLAICSAVVWSACDDLTTIRHFREEASVGSSGTDPFLPRLWTGESVCGPWTGSHAAQF